MRDEGEVGEGFWKVRKPAAWPREPAVFSFSTLMAVELCPRQWALRNASYVIDDAEIRGYPQSIGMARLVGQILHLACESIVRADSVQAVSGVGGRLRSLGGASQILRSAIDSALSQ